jgi:hypothetical protein
MCALSGQDVYKLRRIGAETLGVIEFFALDTAVVPNEHAEDGEQLLNITPVLDIND